MSVMALKTLPVSLTSLVILISASIPLALTDSTGDGTRCTCYMTNGSDASYFSYHKFYDFRSLSQYQGTPGLLEDGFAASSAPDSSDYFKSDTFASFWEIQTWNNSASLGTTNSTVLRINSKNNVFIEKNADPNPSPETWLTLRTARQPMFQSAAEIVTTNDSYMYLSMRMLARTIGAPGGCTAMFTYRPADQSSKTVQEADLEVLTKYPHDQVQCTNQPSIDDHGQLVSEATKNVSLPGSSTWDSWVIYRLDWTPTQSTWYANGKHIANISFQKPRDPSRVHINAWSDGSNWTGTMNFNTEAHLQIQWWELLYNSTKVKPEGSVCKVGCSIDTTDRTGQPLIVFDNMASGRLLGRKDSLAALAGWIPSLAMLAMLLFSSSVLQS